MKRYFDKNKLITAIAISAAMALPSVAVAAVVGPCADCHTMHATDGDGADLASGPQEALTLGGCVACHTGTNDGGTKPYVMSATAPIYSATGTEPTTTTLAGGNFYWVLTGATGASAQKGHNVTTITNVIADTQVAPGGTLAGSALTCAGLSGCHGDRLEPTEFGAISGAHHGGGGTVGTSYRFLDGIGGLEDSDWEFRPTTTAHNQYKGVDRTTDLDEDATTISSLCAQCHSRFHSGAGLDGIANASATFGSPWVRHPTDFDMDNVRTKEYGLYNVIGSAAGIREYSVVAPVGSATVSAVLSEVTLDGTADDDAIVTCISCHRAHATPYDDILRWDYNSATSVIEAGGAAGNVGCFICHTSKD